jgi:hypothetical protein
VSLRIRMRSLVNRSGVVGVTLIRLIRSNIFKCLDTQSINSLALPCFCCYMFCLCRLETTALVTLLTLSVMAGSWGHSRYR